MFLVVFPSLFVPPQGDGVVYFPVQGNDPSCTSSFCNIASICSFVTASAAKGTAAMQTLADLNKAMSAGCTSVSYSSYIKVMASDKNTGRSWPYQTCTEWGFYQTCEEGSSCPFTQGLHNVEMDLRMCEAVFGLTPAQVQASISATNPRYGGRDIRATRIMYPNGDVDPWKAGGVLKTPSGVDPEDAPVLLVAGASHHFWTHPSLATDSSEVVAARQAIWAQVCERIFVDCVCVHVLKLAIPPPRCTFSSEKRMLSCTHRPLVLVACRQVDKWLAEA